MNRLLRCKVVDIELNPVKGTETGKIRPCVIVTNNQYNSRVPVIQVVPLMAWSAKKVRVITNVEISPSADNGGSKRWVADCLQTRPVDRDKRLFRITDTVAKDDMAKIDTALKHVFNLG